jgi:RNA polymerase sigma-70 factor (ECF subfamily)
MQDPTIQQLKNQDRAAIAHLYDRYGHALYGIVFRIVQSEELAEQVIQDTFLKAWRFGANYDESKGKIFTWLLNIARNTAIDATRNVHYRMSPRTDDLNGLMNTGGNDSFNPDTLGLREAVEKMDEKYQTLIDMIYFKGYTQESVAIETGVPIGTIKTRLRSAIMQLRRSFV